MTRKKSPDRKKTTPKRVVIEIAPGIRRRLGAHVLGHNEDPDRVSPPLKLTEVVNEALDAYLSKAQPGS